MKVTENMINRSEMVQAYLQALGLYGRELDFSFLKDTVVRHVATFAFSSVGCQLGEDSSCRDSGVRCLYLFNTPTSVAALQRPRPVAALQRPRPVVVTLTSRLRLTTCRCWENIPGAPALQRQAPDIGGMHGWMLS